MNDLTTNQKISHLIKDFWPIIIFLGTITVGWANISSEIKYQDARIVTLEKRASAVDSLLNQVASDVSFIRGKLEKQ